MKFTHQYDAIGSHRIIVKYVPDKGTKEIEVKGDWAAYHSPAKITIPINGTYMMFTDFFTGYQHKDKPYKITPLPMNKVTVTEIEGTRPD